MTRPVSSVGRTPHLTIVMKNRGDAGSIPALGFPFCNTFFSKKLLFAADRIYSKKQTIYIKCKGQVQESNPRFHDGSF